MTDLMIFLGVFVALCLVTAMHIRIRDLEDVKQNRKEKKK